MEEYNSDSIQIEKLINDFNNSINYWVGELDNYNMNQLRLKPSSESWSMGQLYFHLIDETKFFLSQVELCLSNNVNQYESMTSGAKEQFRNNSFPNQKLKGPPETELQPQPENKEQIKDEFKALKKLVYDIGGKISGSSNKGKSKHPGLGYFNAKEWFQYTDMHLRHHIRQKERIDAYLNLQTL